MKKIIGFCMVIIGSMGIGMMIGYSLQPEPSFWDIGNDDRGCVIYWDDGAISYKSPTVSVGDLEPGEEKEVKIPMPTIPDEEPDFKWEHEPDDDFEESIHIDPSQVPFIFDEWWEYYGAHERYLMVCEPSQQNI